MRKSSVGRISQFVKDYKYEESPLLRKRNWLGLARVLNAAVQDELYVPLTVYGRNRFLNSKTTVGSSITQSKNGKPMIKLTSNEPEWFEAEAIADMILFGLEFYGDPVFDYFTVDEKRYEDVDFWRNVLKFGRITGVGSGKKRVSAIESLENPDQVSWDPDYTHLSAASQQIADMYTLSIVDNGRVVDIKLSTDISTTNAGDPWYVRKNRFLNGKSVRSLIAQEANSLDFGEVSHLPAFTGARAQAAKWKLRDLEEEEVTAESFLVEISKLSREDMITALHNHLEFDFKARIIAAASSVATYQAAPLISEMTWQLRDNPLSHAVYLRGPENLKSTLQRMAEFTKEVKNKLGISIQWFNNDIPTFDQLIRSYHGDVVLNIWDSKTPRAKDKEHLRYIIGTSLIRPLLYLPEPITSMPKTESGAKAYLQEHMKVHLSENLKSGEPDTNRFGSDVSAFTIVAARRESNPYWDKVHDLAKKFGISSFQTDGDDNNTWYEVGADGTITEDLKRTSDILTTRYGFKLHDPLVKGELGLFYTQYRYTWDGRFVTPLSRLKAYWAENNQQSLPPYTEAVKMFQLLEYRWECKGIQEYLNRFIFPYDKTKIGQVLIKDGKRLSLQQFRQMLTKEEEEAEKTTIEMLYSGNPYDERIMSSETGEDGKFELSDKWLRTQFDRVSKAYDAYLKSQR